MAGLIFPYKPSHCTLVRDLACLNQVFSMSNIHSTFIRRRQHPLRIIGEQTCRARSRSSLHTPCGVRTTQKLSKRVGEKTPISLVPRMVASASPWQQFCTSPTSFALLGACKDLNLRHAFLCSRVSSPVEGET